MAPPKQPGVFEAIGRWFDEGASNFRDHLRGAKRKMDDLSDDAAANSKGFSENAAKVGGARVQGRGRRHQERHGRRRQAADRPPDERTRALRQRPERRARLRRGGRGALPQVRL